MKHILQYDIHQNIYLNRQTLNINMLNPISNGYFQPNFELQTVYPSQSTVYLSVDVNCQRYSLTDMISPLASKKFLVVSVFSC